jgi:DNA ligase-1
MFKPLPILYSRTSKGQVQTWQIFIDGGTFFTREGIKGGTISESKPTICKAKNVGRANETTPEQQAESEAQSKWQKKIDGGYWENEADIDNVTTFWPMLAEKWKEYKDFVKEEFEKGTKVFAQAKLDGMRCIVRKDGMWSREGKPIRSAPHIRKALQPLFDQNPDLVFDGELYNHALKHNFNKLISLAKKQKPTPEQLAESEQKLEYWVYDIAGDPAIETALFESRTQTVRTLIRSLDVKGMIRSVYTYEVSNVKEIEALFEKFVDEGFEGLMVRINVPYFRKRTKNLLKYKEFQSKEYKIAGIEDGEGNRAGLATIAYFEDPNGSEIYDGKKCFKAGIIGNNAYTAQLYKDREKAKGKPGEVVYFNLTPDGVPRFGKMKIIRDYD